MTIQSVQIPFSGFYESKHDAAIDDAIISYFDTEGTGDSDVIPDNFWYSFSYHPIFPAYCKSYTDCFEDYFNKKTGLKVSFKYETLTSPREYNFETDRIFADISSEDVQAIFAYTNREIFKKHIADSCTSYDGFISFYSNNYGDWISKDVAAYDHNELKILTEAALLTAGAGDDWEWEVIEDYNCNGELGSIIDPLISAWEAEHKKTA